MLRQLREWFAGLRGRLEAAIIAKAVALAFNRLKAQRLGAKLNAEMDRRFGRDRSDAVQKELAGWLRQVADELST